MLSLEGKQLGNYDVIRRIRVGGMGAVYEGRQRTAFDRRVAIKVILGDYAADRDMRRRFAREARTIARLHHPHILSLIEFGDEKGVLYLVMPFIEGGTLTSYLRRSLPDLEEVSSMYLQLLDAVEYAHEEGLIHRDIKSSNVLLEMRRNAAPYVYLSDFGLVRTMRQNESTQVGKPLPLDQVPGTPHYMAPEQTRGIVTPLTDIYALGVLLYQMLTGNLPYNDPDEVRVIQMHLHSPIPSPCAQDASIPAELGAVVRIAMAKRPEERYRSVADLRNAFLAAVKGPDEMLIEDVTPPEVPTVRPHPSTTKRLEYVRPLEIPEPIIMPYRTQTETFPTLVREVREWQERPHITENARHRLRVTEEPPPRKRQRRSVPGAAFLVLVPLLLLALLIVPRILGLAILPGVPIVGTPAIATVYVTAQTQSLQDTYLLTASTQVKKPDLAAHKIPDRVLQATASNTTTVTTTGSTTTTAATASGSVQFTNTTSQAVTVSSGLLLTTTSGVSIEITQTIQLPAQRHGQVETQSASAVASTPGAAGNIAANALSGTCCNNQLTYKNSAAFTGGIDAQTQHYVSQADLDGVENTQLAVLKQQIKQQIQGKLANGEVLAAQPDDSVKVTSDVPVGAPSDQVQVMIKVSGSAAVYNSAIAAQTAIQLLNNRAATLDKAYQIQEQPALTTPPMVQQVRDGVIYMNVSVRGLWVYTFTQAQIQRWQQSIKDASLDAAQAYLKAQTGIAAVNIRLPFGSNQLPSTLSDIKIVVTPSS